MSTTEWIFSVAAVVIPWIVAVSFVKWARQNDYAQGRRAYYDTLDRNARWGKDMLRGYDDARRGR
jgi:hypothetical protein